MTRSIAAIGAAAGPSAGPLRGVARTGRFGAWRAVAAGPAVAGSLLLLVVAVGWLGRWEVLVLVCWVASGPAVCTGWGERIAVAVGFGFRRPSGAQVAHLGPLWAVALQRAGVAAGNMELYVQRSDRLNAYAAGGRSIAVTSAVLGAYAAGRLSREQVVGLLVHELGHHATRATGPVLLASWWALPWRAASRLVLGVCWALVGRRQPVRLLGGVVVTGVIVAVAQAVQQREWLVAIVLNVVAVCAVVCPLADAAISRRSELAADRFAASCGVGGDLASALLALHGGAGPRGGWVARAFSRHPSVERRVHLLGQRGGASGELASALSAGGAAGDSVPPRR